MMPLRFPSFRLSVFPSARPPVRPSRERAMVDSVKSGPLPRYYQLKEIIRERIRGGEWAPGSLIPSERELCERYGISRMTARQAIAYGTGCTHFGQDDAHDTAARRTFPDPCPRPDAG